jgi:hypothetical protein
MWHCPQSAETMTEDLILLGAHLTYGNHMLPLDPAKLITMILVLFSRRCIDMIALSFCSKVRVNGMLAE